MLDNARVTAIWLYATSTQEQGSDRGGSSHQRRKMYGEEVSAGPNPGKRRRNRRRRGVESGKAAGVIGSWQADVEMSVERSSAQTDAPSPASKVLNTTVLRAETLSHPRHSCLQLTDDIVWTQTLTTERDFLAVLESADSVRLFGSRQFGACNIIHLQTIRLFRVVRSPQQRGRWMII
jgi:hypothetical protein